MATFIQQRDIHYQDTAGSVACGRPMRNERNNPNGWDLGNVTVDHSIVTCKDCRNGRWVGDTRPRKDDCGNES